MPLRPCLDCGTLSPNSRCPKHQGAATSTSWNGTRDRTAQARFRKAVMTHAGAQCQALEHGRRCSVTRNLQAHHTQPGNHDPATGVALCQAHHRKYDKHAR